MKQNITKSQVKLNDACSPIQPSVCRSRQYLIKKGFLRLDWRVVLKINWFNLSF